MKIAILGLSFSGKTTLFKALTTKTLLEESSGTHSLQPHMAVVPISDHRLDHLGRLYHPIKVVPAQVEYMDLVWMGKTSSGTSMMAHQVNLAATADAIAHVVRDFNNPSVAHPFGEINPMRDYKTLNADLILHDLEIIENRLEKLEANMKKRKDKEDEAEYGSLLNCKETLNRELPLRELVFDTETRRRLKGFQFLTAKPQLIILNTDEDRVADQEEIARQFRGRMPFAEAHTDVIAMAGKLEMELCELSEDEREEFMLDLGLKEMGLTKIIRLSLKLLGLITFFTIGQDEVRARSIPEGTNALKAAGTVHTDMERGFIRAEVISFEDLKSCGSLTAGREKGLLRLEGKDYIVKDGDVIHFRFHV